MKLSYAWLQDWIEPPWDAAELGSRLTMVGFELDGLTTLGADSILEVNITPNRGDAMSILGVAREVAALSDRPVTGPKTYPVVPQLTESFPIHVDEPAACPTFCGRIIRDVDNQSATPPWMTARLQSADVRSVSPVVDVTNYVLLELGQPMHAYDLSTLAGEIRVRRARPEEHLQLLDARTVKLSDDILVIADRGSPVGLAGIMGGARTAVTPSTRDVFLEAAYFSPDAIQGRARRLGLHTDASQHYERGVDPALQHRAMERATALLIGIAGGRVGPIAALRSSEYQPQRPPVSLRRTQLARLLGIHIDPGQVRTVLSSLQMQVEDQPAGWHVTPPSYRFDITIEADLIEEVARIVGYGAIPERQGQAPQHFPRLASERAPEAAVLELLSARGYHEAITYAFIDPVLQRRLFPERASLTLCNPIASELSQMRVSLWPGLLRAAAENQRHQQDRIRLIERGVCFGVSDGLTTEVDMLAALAYGPRSPEQWGVPPEARAPADFFDLKADLEVLLAATGAQDSFSFESGQLSCLRPGRAARVLRDTRPVGWVGELHPEIVRALDFTYPPILFELQFNDALRVNPVNYAGVSPFPMVRRDLAIVIDEAVALSALRERVILSSSGLLRQCRVFDVYRGPGLETGTKSIALGLIFQDFSRTLMDEEVDAEVDSIVSSLRVSLNAKIRE